MDFLLIHALIRSIVPPIRELSDLILWHCQQHSIDSALKLYLLTHQSKIAMQTGKILSEISSETA